MGRVGDELYKDTIGPCLYLNKIIWNLLNKFEPGPHQEADKK